MNRGIVIGLLVFGIGTGGGFAWRSGWFPVEFRPAETGSLAGPRLEPSPLAPIVTVSAEAEEPPLAAPEQSEPEPEVGENIAQAVPRRLPLEDDGARPISAARRIDKRTPMRLSRPEEATEGRVEAAAFTEEAEATQPSSTSTEAPRTLPATEPEAQPAADSLDTELAAIDAQLAAQEYLPAHKQLSRIYWERPADRAAIQSRLDSTANIIFFQPQPHFIEPYVIQAGDRMEAIAKKYKLSWEYVAQLNRTQPTRIQVGKRLKLLKGPFGAAVDLQEFALTVHLQGYYVKRYDVGIGKDGSSPLGKFPVLNKVTNPQYTDPDGKVVDGEDPQNPLGKRWIDLGNSYGIHGTIEPDSIGKAASAGCIRLRDQDILEVYNFLVVGSEVTLRN